jgi:hypothetical protein
MSTTEPDPFADPEPPDSAADDAALSTDPRLLARCAELVALKREAEGIEERMAVIDKRRKQIEAFLLDQFANHPELKRLSVDGRTVYLRRQLWAGAPDKAAAHEALIAAGLGEYATKGFNTNSVSALYREWERDGIAPPPELAGVITTGERFSIGVTK